MKWLSPNIATVLPGLVLACSLTACSRAPEQSPSEDVGATATTTSGSGGDVYTGTPDDFMQIHQLYAQYSYGLNMRDPAARAATFTRDGVYQSADGCNRDMGAAAIEGHKPVPTQQVPPPAQPGAEIRNMFPFASLGPIVYIDRDNATVHSLVMLLTEEGPDKKLTLNRAGVYDDKLVRVDGKWKIAHRFSQRRVPRDHVYPPCEPGEQHGFKNYMFPWD